MPKSGSERKTRRQERRRTSQVEAGTPSDRPATLQGERGTNAESDSTDAEQRFPLHLLLEASDGENLTIRELAVRVTGKGLQSSNPRMRNIAARTVLQMEKINQADAHHRAQMRLREAQLQQQSGHLNDSIPCGVVILERPSPTLEAWQAQVTADLASEQAHLDHERSGVDR